jgi:hypothetical protein
MFRVEAKAKQEAITEHAGSKEVHNIVRLEFFRNWEILELKKIENFLLLRNMKNLEDANNQL